MRKNSKNIQFILSPLDNAAKISSAKCLFLPLTPRALIRTKVDGQPRNEHFYFVYMLFCITMSIVVVYKSGKMQVVEKYRTRSVEKFSICREIWDTRRAEIRRRSHMEGRCRRQDKSLQSDGGCRCGTPRNWKQTSAHNLPWLPWPWPCPNR